MLEGLSEEDARWKPAPDRFSVAEVLEHLSHVEGHCFRVRLDLALEQDEPRWEPYDPEMYSAAGQYSGRHPEDSFDHWEDQRADNLECLYNLPEGSARRAGIHPVMGRITLEELVAEWAFHDLGHIRQIAELVRARKYYPRMGPFRSQYTVKP